MKFFIKKQNKGNPQSQAFVDEVKRMLEERGVSDEKARGQCQFYLFQASLKFYKAMARGDEGDVGRMTDEMKEVLAKYGVTEPAQQEEIILNYFLTLNELGAKEAAG